MKKSKTMKKVLAVVLALTMVLGMSAVAFADAGDAYYVVGDAVAYDNPIDVKVVIESRQMGGGDTSAISGIFDVTLGTEGVQGQTFTVGEAMYELHSNAAYGLDMWTVEGKIDIPMKADSTYIKAIEQNGHKFGPVLPMPGDYALDGWMFRVNDQIPLLSVDGTSGPMGTTIQQTPIKDGDVIHFYWEYPYQITATTYYSTLYVQPDVNYANGSLSVQLKDSYSWFDNNYFWHITAPADYAVSTAVTVTDAAGDVVASGTTNAAGLAEISCTLPAGEYYVQADTTSYKDEEGYDEDWNDVVYPILGTTMAYAKLTVQ